MFEQASIDTRGILKSPWATTASLAGQTLVLSAGILISLIHTDALPKGFLVATLAAPGAPIGPAKRAPGSAIARPARSSPHAFLAPTNIAHLSPALAHDSGPLLSLDEPGGEPGLSGVGEGAPGAGLNGFGAVHLPPPPPPTPLAHATEKPAGPALTKPVHVSTGVQAAKIILQVKPIYPALAKQARVSGTVRLVAIIGRDGAIQNLRITSGHPLLTTAAVEAVKQWRYQPTLLNSAAVEVITEIDVNFTLSQ